MTDFPTSFAGSLSERPEEEASREERHQLLATLLGAFADGELPAETASQIDAHLLGCQRCRREVLVQRTLRLRLEQEPLATAPTALRERIVSAIEATRLPQWEDVAGSASISRGTAEVPATESRLPWRVSRAAVAAAVVVILAVAALGVRWLASRSGEAPVSVVPASSVPLFSAALADYRRVMSGDLPGRARDLAGVRDAMPFPVEALQAPSLRLLAAWTTSLNGEPAAVLAYRWNDQVVLQYLVSELQLYRPVELRSAFGNGRLLAAHDGSQNVVAWPEPAWGSVVVADASLDRLRVLRGAVATR
jgi:anti-sigma factor RsiW